MKRFAAAAITLLFISSSFSAMAQSNDKPFGRVKGTRLNVTNLERSVKFYTEVLGLKVCSVVPNGPIKAAMEVLVCETGTFDLGGTPMVVLYAYKGDKPLPAEKSAFGYLLSLAPDIEAISARAVAAGSKAQITGKARDHLIINDPDGYEIMVVQPPKLP